MLLSKLYNLPVVDTKVTLTHTNYAIDYTLDSTTFRIWFNCKKGVDMIYLPPTEVYIGDDLRWSLTDTIDEYKKNEKYKNYHFKSKFYYYHIFGKLTPIICILTRRKYPSPWMLDSIVPLSSCLPDLKKLKIFEIVKIKKFCASKISGSGREKLACDWTSEEMEYFKINGIKEDNPDQVNLNNARQKRSESICCKREQSQEINIEKLPDNIEASENSIKLSNYQLRLLRREMINNRKPIGVSNAQGNHRSGIPATEDEWRSIGHGKHVILVGYYDNGKFGSPKEYFIVDKESKGCSSNPKKNNLEYLTFFIKSK